MMVIEPQEAGEQIRAGNLRVIAALTEKRLATLPNVPTIKEQGIDIPLIPQARGVVAPPGVPREVIAILGRSFRSLSRKLRRWKQYLEQNQFEDGYLKGPGAQQILRRPDRADARSAQRSRRQSRALSLFYERHAAPGALRP